MLGAGRYRDLFCVGGESSVFLQQSGNARPCGSERSIAGSRWARAISYRKKIERGSFIVELLTWPSFLAGWKYKKSLFAGLSFLAIIVYFYCLHNFRYWSSSIWSNISSLIKKSILKASVSKKQGREKNDILIVLSLWAVYLWVLIFILADKKQVMFYKELVCIFIHLIYHILLYVSINYLIVKSSCGSAIIYSLDNTDK